MSRIELTPRGYRIRTLLIAIGIFGLMRMGWIGEGIGSFLFGMCFGFIFLSIKNERKNRE